jgi:hypothetical protein
VKAALQIRTCPIDVIDPDHIPNLGPVTERLVRRLGWYRKHRLRNALRLSGVTGRKRYEIEHISVWSLRSVDVTDGSGCSRTVHHGN